MTQEEFITISRQRGYAYVTAARDWAEAHPRDDYTEQDFAEMVSYLSQVEWHKYDYRKERNDE